MPNWVQNVVIAKDPEVLKKLLINKDGEVDFNLLKPMPKDLDIVSGGWSSYETVRWFNLSGQAEKVKQQEPITELLKSHYKPEMEQREFVAVCMADKELRDKIIKFKEFEDRKDLIENLENYIKGFYNVEKYGVIDWYDWRLANWGTKWNASESSFIKESGTAVFDTAWSMPEGIYQEIAKHTPIRVLWADEDMGNNCGMADFFVGESGEVECQTLMDESVELAYHVWGNEQIPYYNEETEEWVDDPDDIRVRKANSNFRKISSEIDKYMTVESLKEMRG